MRRLTLVPFWCALPVAAALAQQPSLTLGQAIALAEKAAPTVVQAQGNVRSAGAAVRSAWGSFIPSLSTNAGYGSSFSDGPSRLDPISGEVIPGSTSSSSLSLGASASVDLFTGFRRGANLSASRATRTDAEASLVVEQSQIALNTTNQFLQALQGADLVRVRNDAIRRAQDKLAIANAKLVTRAITIADSLQA
ncbi:MAG TPA: TolC family protein, partial [Gemmatimonadales bacterium]|nr:TolC family protein [Gemmatimonadales bacterium]